MGESSVKSALSVINEKALERMQSSYSGCRWDGQPRHPGQAPSSSGKKLSTRASVRVTRYWTTDPTASCAS
jgi:hypothetical protein